MPTKFKIDNFNPIHLTKSYLNIEKKIKSLEKDLEKDKVVLQKISLWEKIKKLGAKLV